MALDQKIRDTVKNYVLKEVAPSANSQKKANTKVEILKEFEGYFSFVEDEKLKVRLADTFYQARLMEKMREALQPPSGPFHDIFVQTQIVLYASIYEALINYVLEQKKDLPEVTHIYEIEEYKPVPAFASKTELLHCGEKVYPCKISKSKLTNQEIKFTTKLKAVISIDCVEKAVEKNIDKHPIARLYASRNAIHIDNAIKKGFKPAPGQSSEAYTGLFKFLTKMEDYLTISNP